MLESCVKTKHDIFDMNLMIPLWNKHHVQCRSFHSGLVGDLKVMRDFLAKLILQKALAWVYIPLGNSRLKSTSLGVEEHDYFRFFSLFGVPGNGLGFGFYCRFFEKVVQSKSGICFQKMSKSMKFRHFFQTTVKIHKMSKSNRKQPEQPLFEPPEAPE